jgi:hypothetical protein
MGLKLGVELVDDELVVVDWVVLTELLDEELVVVVVDWVVLTELFDELDEVVVVVVLAGFALGIIAYIGNALASFIPRLPR